MLHTVGAKFFSRSPSRKTIHFPSGDHSGRARLARLSGVVNCFSVAPGCAYAINVGLLDRDRDRLRDCSMRRRARHQATTKAKIRPIYSWLNVKLLRCDVIEVDVRVASRIVSIPGRPCLYLYLSITIGSASRRPDWRPVTGWRSRPRPDRDHQSLKRAVLNPATIHNSAVDLLASW